MSMSINIQFICICNKEISIAAIFYENKLEIIEIIMIDNIEIC